MTDAKKHKPKDREKPRFLYRDASLLQDDGIPLQYSFDHAQQVHYPHYAQQVGPLFFKTPRKYQCFGICAEGSGM